MITDHVQINGWPNVFCIKDQQHNHVGGFANKMACFSHMLMLRAEGLYFTEAQIKQVLSDLKQNTFK